MKIGLDLDGTLLDSSWRHVLALRRVWPGIDDVLTDWTQGYLQSKTHGESTKQYLAKIVPERADELSAQWVEHIEDDDLLLNDKPYAGALEFLDALLKKNELYLATARKNTAGTQRQIAALGLGAYFSEVHVVPPGRNAGGSKAEALAHQALDFVIGDTESDMHWAHDAKATFISVSWGFRSPEYWRGHDAVTVDNYAKLLSHFRCE